MDVDRVSRRTTGTPASPPTESLLLPPGAENDDLFISKTNHGWRMVKIYDIRFIFLYGLYDIVQTRFVMCFLYDCEASMLHAAQILLKL